MIRCFLLLFLSLWCTGVRAQVSLVNQKGTVMSVDSSKWKLTDTNIYNKNSGNVGIGTNGAPNSSAVLEVRSASKGLLIPRIALTSATATTPLAAHVAGMIVYNTATAGTVPNAVSPGFYFNNGTKWVKVADILQADTTNDGWKDDAANTQISLAYLSNSTTVRPAGTEFVIKDDGRVGLGNTSPAYKLDVKGQAHADSTISAPNYTATVQAITGTWNLNLGANASWTLASGANTLTVTNAKAGMFGLIRVTNAGTSTITLPAGSRVINGGGGVVPLTQVASAVDILTFYYDGTNYWWTYGNNYN